VEVRQGGRHRVGLVNGVGKISDNKVGSFVANDGWASEEAEALPIDASKLLHVQRVTKYLGLTIGVDGGAEGFLEE
jgi:hypothetical protein